MSMFFSDQEQASPSTAPLKGTVNTSLALLSTEIGTRYPLQIYLPPDASADDGQLAAIYLLDAELEVEGHERFTSMAQLAEDCGAKAMLIGIGNNARRAEDYTMPGALAFYRFLSQELLPFVESRFPVNPSQRTLVGHSLGGLFAVLALLQDRPQPRCFRHFVSQDGSFWHYHEATSALEQALFVASGGQLPDTTLILSSSAQGNDEAVQTLYQHFHDRQYQGLVLRHLPSFAEDHNGMVEPSFRAALRLLFPHRKQLHAS